MDVKEYIESELWELYAMGNLSSTGAHGVRAAPAPVSGIASWWIRSSRRLNSYAEAHSINPATLDASTADGSRA